MSGMMMDGVPGGVLRLKGGISRFHLRSGVCAFPSYSLEPCVLSAPSPTVTERNQTAQFLIGIH